MRSFHCLFDSHPMMHFVASALNRGIYSKGALESLLVSIYLLLLLFFGMGKIIQNAQKIISKHEQKNKMQNFTTGKRVR